MTQHLKPFLVALAAVVVGLVIYNMFIVGHFGMFEGSNNYDVDEQGNILKVA